MEIAFEFKLHSARASGTIWHYGHYVHDFLMPFHSFYRDIGSPDHVVVNLINNSDQSIGNMKTIHEFLYPVRVNHLEEAEFEEHEAAYREIVGCAYGPYNRGDLQKLFTYAVEKFDLEDHSYPEIVLIERGSDLMPFGNPTDSGSNRRTIRNHDALAKRLIGRYGNRVKNVVLENTSYLDQMSLFYNAKLVVGQHGAGLCNIIWMRDQSRVVEIGPGSWCRKLDVPVSTFPNMCLAKDIDYSFVNYDPKVDLEIDSVLTAIEGYETCARD